MISSVEKALAHDCVCMFVYKDIQYVYVSMKAYSRIFSRKQVNFSCFQKSQYAMNTQVHKAMQWYVHICITCGSINNCSIININIACPHCDFRGEAMNQRRFFCQMGSRGARGSATRQNDSNAIKLKQMLCCFNYNFGDRRRRQLETVDMLHRWDDDYSEENVMMMMNTMGSTRCLWVVIYKFVRLQVSTAGFIENIICTCICMCLLILYCAYIHKHCMNAGYYDRTWLAAAITVVPLNARQRRAALHALCVYICIRT